MLKKTDLTKQFELVIKQEIKNYQDSLNYILQSLREIKETVEFNRIESLENHALIHSIQNDLSIEFSSVKEALISLSLRFEKLLTDQRVINERNTLESRDLSNAIHSLINENNKIHEKINTTSYSLGELHHTTYLNKKISDENLEDLYKRFIREISKTKKEIIEAPTEASKVRTILEEKIASYNLDVAGIMRELQIYKKENMITQKKIENIYTLIERLKKVEKSI